MFEKIDHIAIAVENLDEAIATYETVFGAKVAHREVVGDFGVEIATIIAGDTAIELLEAKRDDSPIRKFVDTRGPGLHHLAFAVADIHEALRELREAGIRLIDETPRRGKENSLVAFIHPKATDHVLYELVQPASKPGE